MGAKSGLAETPAQGIDYFNKQHPLMKLQGKLSLWMREKMFRRIPLEPGMRVLEVGATPDMDLIDSNFFSLRAKAAGCDVSVTSIEDCSAMAAAHGFHWVPFDVLQKSPPAPYDAVISSAVIEHVGASDEDKLRHLRLLSTSSARWVAVTTPNRSHWLELHTKLPFLHWLPKTLHRRLLLRLGMASWADPSHLDLLNGREFRSLVSRAFARDQVAFRSFWFLGWISHLMAIVEKRDPGRS